MKRIYIMLQMTADEYQQRYLEEYMRWCQSWATTPYGGDETDLSRMQREIMETRNDFQKLCANSAISRWHLKEYAKRENQFIADYHDWLKRNAGKYQPHSKDELTDMYLGYVRELFKYYPKTLFEAARKLTIINDISAN